MNFFELANQKSPSGSGSPPKAMSLGESVWFGALYFTLTSLVVFGVWSVFGRALSAALTEGGFYAICALVYISLAGILLRQLVIFKPTPLRFFLFFASSFGVYAVIWSLCWILVRGHTGETLGSMVGTFAMAAFFCHAFNARSALVRVALVLFIGNALGYFVGGYVYEAAQHGALSEALSGTLSKAGRATAAKFLWGIVFGMGFGGGMGYAFYACQETIRGHLKSNPPVI